MINDSMAISILLYYKSSGKSPSKMTDFVSEDYHSCRHSTVPPASHQENPSEPVS